jgi:hypothetical protein
MLCGIGCYRAAEDEPIDAKADPEADIAAAARPRRPTGTAAAIPGQAISLAVRLNRLFRTT